MVIFKVVFQNAIAFLNGGCCSYHHILIRTGPHDVAELNEYIWKYDIHLRCRIETLWLL